jgi:hypothetical protein
LGALAYYERYITTATVLVLLIWVRRFLCRHCRISVSCLPDFAQPYRAVNTPTVEQPLTEAVQETPELLRLVILGVQHTRSCMLYLPAGTYRITNTLKTTRKAHTDCQGVAVIGEDPARTILRWDGGEGGTIFQWDAWYSKISRLTFDGAGRAGTALLYGPAFSTYNETSDLIFRDATNGLVFGGPQTADQAENAVLRCQFLRRGTGIQTVNWNSMDIWVWSGRFGDCGRGVHNVMGNWHVWQSVLLRSRIADLSSINLMAFSAVNNTSVGSRCFFDFSTGHTWGSPVSLTGNRVLDPTRDWAVILDNAGPYLVVDNQFRIGPSGRAIRMTWADQTLVGNTYTRGNAVEERGHFRRIAERVVSAHEIPDALPTLPSTPPHRERKVVEVQSGADREAIQQAIDEAAKGRTSGGSFADGHLRHLEDARHSGRLRPATDRGQRRRDRHTPELDRPK